MSAAAGKPQHDPETGEVTEDGVKRKTFGGFSAIRRAGLQGHAAGKLVHLGHDAQIEVGALPGGMASGAPSVAFCFSLPDGRVVLAETSLALFLGAGDALKARYGDPRRTAALEQETERVRVKTEAAMSDQAAQGSTRQGVFEAGIRAALDHAVADLPQDLGALTEVLGERVDAGAFLLGSLVSTLMMSGADPVDAARFAGAVLREYMAKAREVCS